MIIEIQQSLVDVKEGVCLHGCNCLLVMGAGVAKAIRDKYPVVYDRYRQEHTKGLHNLGNVQFVKIHERLYFANGFTQATIGWTGIHADINAIREVIYKSLTFASSMKLPFLMSKIGCNHGGLDWKKEVNPVLEEVITFLDYREPVTVCIWP